jgi:UPF0716 family protein affecting phage T7 exclusion
VNVYEHKNEPLISRREFAQRLGHQGLYALALVAVSVVFGMAGYHWIAGQGWVDAFLNTTMLLGGMGPVGELSNDAAKIFAGFFALYAGLVFLAVSILLLTPVFHRVLHHFHWEISSRQRGPE